MYFIDVILPIPLRQSFTYNVNRDEAYFLKQGMRVAVPFGKSKIYTAIVYRIHQNDPPSYETKSIDHILDEAPIILERQMKHWEWMASYYMCTLGEVVRAALPGAFLLESETIISLEKKEGFDESNLADEEFLVYEALKNQSSLHINDVRSILDRKQVLNVIHKLMDRGLVGVKEEVYEQYRPKIKRYIKLSGVYSEEEKLRELLDSMNRAPKQRQLLMTLFMLSSTEKNVESVLLQKRSKTNAAVIRTLIDKGILEEYFLQKDRIEYEGERPSKVKKLTDAQEVCLQEIRESYQTHASCLLHGVTSSGKTEIYVQLIESMLSSGKQILYMLPEIALTTQLISRLQAYFGEKISVFHSRYSMNERVEVWNHVLHRRSKAQIVIGARSSLFLPFSDLGLVIVDEEHEPSFKQFSPSPRYHARDAAIFLANLHGAKTLLGSATPSLESFYNAREGKFGLVQLKERFGKVMMPEIELVDIREKLKKRRMTGHFSDRLLEEITASLREKEQVILFQNRRGYSPVVECTTCGVAPQCPNCDVSLTYHQFRNELRCHYCGYTMAMLVACLACGSETLDTKGFGTEQIETELKELFPDKIIARMDQDTTRGKHAYAKLIERMEEGEIDLLVGTQMLAKGLDFRNVSLVGVMNADNLLNFPDFRAHERSFQLLQQVSGRSGRTEKQGKVIIQSYNPLHQILQQVSTNDYRAMFEEQSEERRQYNYPPFYRAIRITFKHRNFDTMQKASVWFAEVLKMQLGEQVLGPVSPPVGRIRNEFISNVLVKISREQSLPKTKEFMLKVLQRFMTLKEFSRVKLTIDVDPY